MSRIERWACVNPAWRAFSARVVVPWVIAGEQLDGRLLEIGAGSGANAAALLERCPQLQVVATDVDPAMVEIARRRLAPFGERAEVRLADAGALDVDDGSIDVVASCLMLHHVTDRAAALGEVARVLREGGRFVGYDLVRAGPAAWIDRSGHTDHRYATVAQMRSELHEAGMVDVRVETARVGVVMRFSGRRVRSDVAR